MTALPDIRPFEISINTPQEEINRLYSVQQSNRFTAARTSVQERKTKIKIFKQEIIAHQQEFRDALFKDYFKPAVEVDLAEILVLLNEINYTFKKLDTWVAKHRVGTPWFLFGANSYVHYEAKGHVLVISPWNYPIHLTLMPLLHSYAAGNVTLIKPSEFTPYTTAVVKKVIEKVFRPEEACVVEGDAEVSKYITTLRFDHIFFTGSPQIGKLVMKAAAVHLSSVTLELGGKSPMIIDDTCDLDLAASFASSNKLLNSGQYCVAPDIIFVHENRKRLFIEKLISQFKTRAGSDIQALASGDYCQIINLRQANRIKVLLEDAISKGAKVEYRSGEDDDTLIGPVILSNTNNTMTIDQDEIFGPICNIKSYHKIDEVIEYINAGEKPLSLFLFSRDLNTKKRVRNETSSGNMCINTTQIHYFNYNLPFGGVNHSGMGKSHGFYSFKEFSNAKAVINQWMPWPSTLLFFPPFDARTKRIAEILLRFFK